MSEDLTTRYAQEEQAFAEALARVLFGDELSGSLHERMSQLAERQARMKALLQQVKDQAQSRPGPNKP